MSQMRAAARRAVQAGIAEDTAQRAAVSSSLQGLSEDARNAVAGRLWLGYTYEQLGFALNVRSSAARVLVRRSLQQVAEQVVGGNTTELRSIVRTLADGTSASDSKLQQQLNSGVPGFDAFRTLTVSACRVDDAQRRVTQSMSGRFAVWTIHPVVWAMIFAAAIKAGAGLAFALTGGSGSTSASFIYTSQVAAYFGSAIPLILGSRDRRSIYLGGLFLMVASSFSDRALASTPLLAQFPIDAFIPLMTTLFVEDFPKVPASVLPQRAVRLLVLVNSVLGLCLFMANLYLLLHPSSTPIPLVLTALSRSRRRSSPYWWSIQATVALALLTGVVKTRYADAAETRRAKFMVYATTAGFLPLIVAVLFNIRPVGTAALVVYAALLTVPVSGAYAALVIHLFDVELTPRGVFRHVLRIAAWNSVVIVAIALVGLQLYKHRDESIAALLGNRQVIAFLTVAVTVVLAAWWGNRVRQRRLRTSGHLNVADMVQAIAKNVATASGPDFAHSASRDVARLFGVDSAVVLLTDTNGRMRARADLVPLSADSAITALAHSGTLLDLDPADPGSVFDLLPMADQNWVTTTAASIGAPMRDAEGRLIGLIVLGPKSNDLPFSAHERRLLQAIAEALGSIAVAVSGGEHAEAASMATECPACGRVESPDKERCSCGTLVGQAVVPHIVARKIRVDRRLGAGGMGVVYQAWDDDLRRVVAIKTLPLMTPAEALLLKREARMMAAVRHPNIATIFDADFFGPTPVLVMEYLENGTLRDRLRQDVRLSPDEVVRLGVALADGLAALHRVSILHRDVKPSNIGFDEINRPKLLDFGIAKASPMSIDSTGDGSRDAVDRGSGNAELVRVHMTGTLPYLSPEVVEGSDPTPQADLWSLSVVLYESLTGSNPFAASTREETIRRIRSGELADPRLRCPECSESLVAFLRSALSPHHKGRPGSAVSFIERLAAVGSSSSSHTVVSQSSV